MLELSREILLHHRHGAPVTQWEYEHLADEMRSRLRSADDPMIR